MHNNIMAAGFKECPPMLALGPYIMTEITHPETLEDGNRKRVPSCIEKETYANRSSLESPSTSTRMVKICDNCQARFYKMINGLVRNNLLWEFGKFTSRDEDLIESYYTRNKGKENVKPPSPPSESTSEDESDEEQIDKHIQKSLALIVKHFKNIYRPTNNDLRTSSNTMNKNVDTSLRTRNDRHTRQFGNQRVGTIAGNKEPVEN
nr:hypothetical protein [Tanacetum cinerariifolium]